MFFIYAAIIALFVVLVICYVRCKVKPFNPHYVPKTKWRKESPYFDASQMADSFLVDK